MRLVGEKIEYYLFNHKLFSGKSAFSKIIGLHRKLKNFIWESFNGSKEDINVFCIKSRNIQIQIYEIREKWKTKTALKVSYIFRFQSLLAFCLYFLLLFSNDVFLNSLSYSLSLFNVNFRAFSKSKSAIHFIYEWEYDEIRTPNYLLLKLL